MSLLNKMGPISPQLEAEKNEVAGQKTCYCVRESFKDIFGVYLLETLSFEGNYDMPVIGNFDDLTCIEYLALYSEPKDYTKTINTCVCFYQYDHVFDGIHGLYNSRICACWLAVNTSASIIPNLRWTFPFSFDYCFDGIMKGSNIAIGLLGQMHHKENRKMFLNGFKIAIDRIIPKSIITYGFVTNNNIKEYLGYAIDKHIPIIVPHSKIDMYKKEDAFYGQWK